MKMSREEKERRKQKIRERIQIKMEQDNYEFFPGEDSPSIKDIHERQMRVAVYARVSTDNEEQTTSIELHREMEGGFGIAPVPIYRTADAHGASVYDGYNVQIDHLGKVCGIAACTTKFSQCTAFLNYQSMNSREIIKEYYNGVLNERNPKDVADSNAQIFALLRNSIGSGLDMMLEDAIAQYYKAYNSNSTLYKWHEMIKADEYQCTSMKIKYGEIASLRDSYLQLLKYEYEAFT